MDLVLLRDGRLVRVLGNVEPEPDESQTQLFLGYVMYVPDEMGARLFRGERYSKKTVQSPFARDVWHESCLFTATDVSESFDPMETVRRGIIGFEGSVWETLYVELCGLVGSAFVGVFGSALAGDTLHLDSAGRIANDVDFFIEGEGHIADVMVALPRLCLELGFAPYSVESAQKILSGWARRYRNENNSLPALLSRRWSGMEWCGNESVVLNTIRFRDCHLVTSAAILIGADVAARNVESMGVVTEARMGNLYPRSFLIQSSAGPVNIHCLWWHISSPVLEGDVVSVCGDLVAMSGTMPEIRLTDYKEHWLRLHGA